MISAVVFAVATAVELVFFGSVLQEFAVVFAVAFLLVLEVAAAEALVSAVLEV